MATAPKPNVDTSYFFQQLSECKRGNLILDFETTLARLSRSPFPYPSVEELLDCLMTTTDTRVIVTSAQPSKDLLPRFAPPRPEIWGREILQRLTPERDSARHARDLLQMPIEQLRMGSPVAYLAGVRTQQGRLLVYPELHLGRSAPMFAPAEDLLQFLVDWLRACCGEVC